MEPVTATSGTEEEVVGVTAKSEGYNEVVDMPEESTSRDPSYLADSASGRAIEQGTGSDHVVDLLATEAGELLENAQGCYRNGGKNRKDEHKVEEKQRIGKKPKTRPLW